WPGAGHRLGVGQVGQAQGDPRRLLAAAGAREPGEAPAGRRRRGRGGGRRLGRGRGRRGLDSLRADLVVLVVTRSDSGGWMLDMVPAARRRARILRAASRTLSVGRSRPIGLADWSSQMANASPRQIIDEGRGGGYKRGARRTAG